MTVVRRSRLGNGLRVVTAEMKGVPSATVGIWVENGSRYETPAQSGISHFLEHLLFKGTERRSAARIAEEIDALGGVLNAFTGKEYTCYYAKVLAEHLPIAEDVLGDIFLHSRFDPEEIDRERTVVLQEILQGEDTPDEHVHDLFSANFWPANALGEPICGRPETVESFGRADFVDFVGARYRPDRTLVSAAGHLSHDEVCAWAESVLGRLEGTACMPPAETPHPRPGVFVTERSIEQVHICLGVPAVSHCAPERYAAYLLNTALGGGMSSRLFQEIREKRGRAYSVYSFLSSYRDTGYLGIYAATGPEWVEEVLTVVRDELTKVTAEGLGADELARSKNQLKGNLLLGMETSDSQMNRVARNEIFFARDVTPREVADSIDAVTHEDILALADTLFRPQAMSLTLLGDLKGRRIGDDILAAA
jgi:predicted Zn-dependent peptidase